jgi:hypothetical protein
VKDALERELHKLVCAGQLDLEKAQHEIASNWIEAYKKYVRASPPASTVQETKAAAATMANDVWVTRALANIGNRGHCIRVRLKRRVHVGAGCA